jgi:hypothetical protein
MGKNAWLDHVKTVRRTPEAKDLSFKEVLKLAKKSYKKISDNVNDKLVKPISAENIKGSVKKVGKKMSNKVVKPMSRRKKPKRKRGKKRAKK